MYLSVQKHTFLFVASIQDFAFRLYKIFNFILSRIPSVQELKKIFPSPPKKVAPQFI